MTGHSDPITYVDHDPLIPTHLGTDAPHVHVRSTDRCLRRPEGVECLSPAELRAEVERLGRVIADRLGDYALFGRSKDGDSTLTGDLAADMAAYAQRQRARAESAEAEVERLRQGGSMERANEFLRHAESAEAERDALQQRLAALAEDIRSTNAFLAHSGDTHDAAIYGAALAIADRIDDALDGPAAPPQEPQPTPEAIRLCLSRHGGWFQHVAGRQPCVTCRHDAARQSEPVERITDAHGDETERGADTDTENPHQQDGDHR